jgi:hypothetical protein
MKWRASSDSMVREWHRWFAWYPVRVDGSMVWFEFVERQSTFYNTGLGGVWEHEYRTVSGS